MIAATPARGPAQAQQGAAELPTTARRPAPQGARACIEHLAEEVNTSPNLHSEEKQPGPDAAGAMPLRLAFAALVVQSSRGERPPPSGIEWTKWVRVAWWAGNSQPAWLDRDAVRQYAFDTLQPDIVDWYQGLSMDRGQFFRSRGVAVSTGSGWEYDQDFALQTSGGTDFTREHFLGNGVDQEEDGSPVIQGGTYQGTYAMEHFAPRWQQVELQGLARRAVLGDSVSQDNIGAQYAFQPHWSDWSCRRFVQWLQQRNVTSVGGVPLAELNVTSGVRQRLAQLRAANQTNDQISIDPLIREYMRFMMASQTEHWRQIIAAAKAVAWMSNHSEPAAYGNLGSAMTSNYSRPGGMVLQQSVDVMWNEDTGPLAGLKNYSASLNLKLSEAAGTKPDGTKTPNWIDRESSVGISAGTGTDCTFNQVNAAEATANDATLVGCISTITPDDACWKAFSAHATLVQSQLWLFIDRQRVSEAAFVYSLPTIVWRHFSTVSTLFDGGWDSVAAQQTPLGRHMLWLTYASRLLDEAHLTSRGQILGHPDLMKTAPALDSFSNSTKLLVIPGADAVSDEHAAKISAWVKAGGHLMLWGEDSGEVDEELMPRPGMSTCWSELLTDPGQGAVTVVDSKTISDALGGVSSKPPDAAAEQRLVELLQAAVPDAILQTPDAPSDVYVNVFAHGAGDSAVSVDMVHFSLNSSDFAPSFKIRVRAPSWCTLAYFYSVEAPGGQALQLSRAGGFVEVAVPSFHVFGVVAIVAKGELEFRSAAASLRRLANRLAIAGRSTGADSHTAVAAAERATEVSSTAQGTPHASFPRSIIAAVQKEAADANQALLEITRGIGSSLSTANVSLRASGRSAVWAAKFGLGRCGTCTATFCEAGNIPFGFVDVVYNDPAYEEGRSHGFLNTSAIGHAITAAGDSPGKYPGMNATTFYDCFYFDYFLESSPQIFRIANLPSGEYVATIVTGSYTDYEEVAHTAVSSPSDPGAGMLGDRSQSGIWQHRAFRVRVDENGTLDLLIGSRNTGSLFQSAYNGWGDGMVSWALQALTLHSAADTHLLTPWARESLAKNDAVGSAALRHWLVAGPFSDRNATGLERSFSPEQAAPVDPSATFAAGWSAADLAAGAPVTVGWTVADLPPTGSAVAVEIPFALPHAFSNCSVAVAAASFTSRKGGAAMLRVSSAQQSVVSLNGEVIGIKRLAAGTMADDAEWVVHLKPGANVLMLRLTLHFGSFHAHGGNSTFESATDFTAGVWSVDGKTPLRSVIIV